MNIDLQTIPHAAQRYDTCGDWWWSTVKVPKQERQDTLHMRISRVGGKHGWKFEMCVAIHELVEALLCKARGVTQDQVDAFDMGPGALLEEPGDDPAAPYHAEHRAAYTPEFFLLKEFGLSKRAYDRALDKFYPKE